ncbi:MAG: ComEC/Rec2 family competence protein [Chloroflexi bacterium]|nr:ComEC/Rec2 family competence protein [Chloroflexota bacterium]
MTIIYLCIAWLTGVYIGSKIIKLPEIFILSIILLTLTLLAIMIAIHYPKMKLYLLSIIILIFFIAGVIRFPRQSDNGIQSIATYNETEVSIRGTITSDPEVRDKYTIFYLSNNIIYINEKWKTIDGTVLIYAGKYPDSIPAGDFPYYRYGDVMEMKGTLQKPPGFDDFDYAAYLSRKGVYSISYYPGLKLIDSNSGSNFLAAIYRVRTKIYSSLSTILHEPECSLCQAILLGTRGKMSDNLTTTFVNSGTMHLIAISGVNITIIAGLFSALGIFIFGKQRRIYLLIPLIVIWLYTIIAGMPASAVRAAVMGSIFLFAESTGRQNSGLIALSITVMIMVGIQPNILWDAGFQLSALAMAGLILLSPVISVLFNKLLDGIFKIKNPVQSGSFRSFVINNISVTLGAVVATLPAIAYYFHTISLVTIPATIIAMPVLPSIIIIGSLTGITGIAAPAVAQVFGWVTWLLLRYMILVTQLFSSIPSSVLNIEFEFPYVVTGYSVLIILIIIYYQRSRIANLVRKRT